MFRVSGHKKTFPMRNVLGQEIKCSPAVPPGLTLTRPLSAYYHMPAFDDGAPNSGLHTREIPFPRALKSPFILILSAAIPPPAALFAKVSKDYLYFLIGLAHYNPMFFVCQ